MALTMSMLLVGIGPAQASDDDNGGLDGLGILGILGGDDGDDDDEDDDDDDDDGNDCLLGILCIFNG
ncbi:MAG: hypothetical protein ACRDYX_11775 [Egibacteraceae bacterium]